MRKKKDNTIFAKNLKYLIKQKGTNQKKVCEDLNIQQTTFCDYYNGRTYPRPTNLKKISDYFNVRIDELVYQDLMLNTGILTEDPFLELISRYSKDLTEEQLKTLEQIIILLIRKEEISITWSKKI